MRPITIKWSENPRPIGQRNRPHARLLGTLDIDGVPFHAEFIQVRINPTTGEQQPVQKVDTNWDALSRIDEYAPFHTITYNRRRYTLLITPFCQ